MVLGFLFSENREKVCLIEKQKPEWQKGLLNGIGGKIELGETAIEAMVREFNEEAGLKLNYVTWEHFATMNGKDWKVYCYVAFSDSIFWVKTNEIEIVSVFDTNHVLTELHDKTISNLQWLIPMALDKSDNFTCNIVYQ